jgi:hypothetical protein
MENWSSNRKLAGSHADWQVRLADTLKPLSDWSNALHDIVMKVMDGTQLSLD